VNDPEFVGVDQAVRGQILDESTLGAFRRVPVGKAQRQQRHAQVRELLASVGGQLEYHVLSLLHIPAHRERGFQGHVNADSSGT